MIRRQSKKRSAQNREYEVKRKLFLKENPECGVKRIGICSYHATTVHHKKGRIGSLLTDDRFFLGACIECHYYIETHPLWAKEKGFSLSRLQKD